MIWKPSRFRLTGVSPLIVHNGQLADKLNYFAKEISKISGKKKKTDADYEQMAKLEFLGGLYVDESKRPILPTEGIEAIVVAGAKKSKQGMNAKAGVYCPNAALLQYDGPKDPEELWLEPKFRITVGVRIEKKRIMRTRPLFPDWTVDIDLCCNMEICSEEEVYQWLKVAGEQCGAFDWRPKFGRFRTEQLAQLKKAV